MAFQQLRRGGGAAAPSAVVEVSDGLEPGQGPSSVYLAAEEALAALALGGGGHTLRTPQPPGRCGAQAQAVSSAVKARRKIRSPSPGTPASSRVHGRSGGGGFSPEGVEWTSDCGRDTLDIVPVAGKTPHTGGAAHHRRRAGVRHAANSSTCRTSPRSERASSPFADPTEARRRALDGIAPRSPDRATVASRMKRQRKVVSRQSEASSAPGGLAYGSYTPPMYSDRGG